MKKWILFSAFFCAPAMASVRPVVTFSLGQDFANFSQSQNIILTSPFTNTYQGTSDDDEPVGGLFIGVESPIFEHLSGQLGLTYYQTSQLRVNGTVYQFSDADMGNLYYYYKINSRRLLAQAKLFTNIGSFLHPFVIGGIGRAWNTAYQYHEEPVTSADVAMLYVFPGRTSLSTAYVLGAGIDYDVSMHVRFGVSYQFSNIGTAGLGKIPEQSSDRTLSYKNLGLNEFLFSVTYIG